MHTLSQSAEGELKDRETSQRLFDLIYDELYRLAQDRLKHESPGHTLQPTALVNEVFLRLVCPDEDRQWDGKGHFFAAAARAMRQILIDNARRKRAGKRMPVGKRVNLAIDQLTSSFDDEQLLELHDALSELERSQPIQAQLVELKFFAGMEMAEIGSVLGISRATAQRYWSHARAWLFLRMSV